MKGKFFGYRVESPCAQCGTARYGVDCDDDYYLFAGTISRTPKVVTSAPSPLPGHSEYSDILVDGVVVQRTVHRGWLAGHMQSHAGERVDVTRLAGCPDCAKVHTSPY